MRQWGRILALLLVVAPATAWCEFGKNTPGMFLDDAPPATTAKPKHNNSLPVVMDADEMGYDKNTGIAIARGHVEVMQGDYLLRAEQVTYFQNSDKVVAQGHVVLLQPSGDVLFAESAQLRDAMKRGVIDQFQMRFADNSVMVAKRAQKVNPAVMKMQDAQYTPCHICEGIAPFWQIDAGKVRVDDLSERITYRDTTFDLMGVPLLYTPYLSTPTPNSQAKSGFFPPQYGNNQNLGTLIKVPYYWRINDDKEAMITPWYTSEEGLLLYNDYHQLTDHGEYRVIASATNPSKLDDAGNPIGGNEFRGHIFATGSESLDDDSRIGFDIQRTTDDTYLRRYSFGSEPALYSRLYGETSDNRNFGLIQGLAIQGLRATDDPHTTPLVLPMLQGYYETLPNDYGMRYHVSGDAQSLTREQGIDQRRVSMTVGASLPYITDGGHVLTTTVNLRQDAYNTNNIPVNGVPEDADTYRTIPQLALEWKYPLINQYGHNAVTIEPVMLAVAQPKGGNPATISNEDNGLLELTDTNLFSIDRMPGLDLIDSGPRVAYGARGQYLFEDGTSIDALLGQNYNVTHTPFPNSSDPGANFSDYIGRVGLTITPWTLAYRFAVDKDDGSLNRNEVTVGYAQPWFTVMTSYRSVRNNEFLGTSEEGEIDIAFPITENWSVYGGTRRNFDTNQFETASSGIVFKNECFNINFDGERIYSRDRDVAPQTSFYVRVALKNLGEFGGH